jgi:hypothetical protein
MKNYADYVGTWVGKNKYYDNGPNAVAEGDATIVVSYSLGGRYLEHRYTMDMGPMGKGEGLMLMTYDPATKTNRGWWFDSFSGEGMEMSSSPGKLDVFESKPIKMGAETVTIRSSYVRTGDTAKMLVEVKRGAEWRKMVEGTYTRKK